MVKFFEWLDANPRISVALILALIGVAGSIAGPLEVAF